MSRKYENTKDVPTAALVIRLRELSDAVTGGRAATESEFSMRVPAECDRDADLVLAEAAERLEALEDALRYYADPTNYTHGDVPMHIYALDDAGSIARKALGNTTAASRCF